MLLCAFGLYLYLVLVLVFVFDFDFIAAFFLFAFCVCVCVYALEMRESSLDFIAVLAINNGALSIAAKKLRKNQRIDQQLEQFPNAKWNYKQIVNSKSNKRMHIKSSLKMSIACIFTHRTH